MVNNNDGGAEYPFVECGDHGVQMSYAVCRHVLWGAPAFYALPCSMTEMGVVACAACRALPQVDPDHFDQVCQLHAQRYILTHYAAAGRS